MMKTSICDCEKISTVTYPFYFINGKPMLKQTLCKVLNIFQHGKYLVAYVLKVEMKANSRNRFNQVYFVLENR